MPNVQPTQAGNYSVVVSNSAGSVTSAVAALTILSPPVITAQPQSLSVMSGVNVTFSVAATGTAPLSYRWRFNGANLPGNAARNASYVVNNAQPSSAGDYTVVVSNSSGSVTSTVAVLTVNAPPSITAQPQSQTVALGSNTTLNVTAVGGSPLSFQWRRDGVDLTGATSAALSIANAQASNAGNYSVRVSNPVGTVTSVVATLTVSNSTSTNSFKVLSVSLLPNHQSRITISGNSGERYSIEASSNLLNWIVVGTTTNSAGTAFLLDALNTNSPACFYRARLLP